ncbi:hypothetical protein [Streptomyces sp. NPDC059906]|uniref:hypothetical protein n=1 Tax=Streptomyces sp. NPDC059906 TaxID=3346997 RepID=UPI003659CD32
MTSQYSSSRHFTVWQYTIAHHSRILLRSPRRTLSDVRIDLHIGSVSAMLVRPSYDGLVIRGCVESEMELIASIVGPQVFARGERVHVIGEDRMTGFILGGPLEHQEACMADDEPSGFLRMPATK